MATLSTSRTAFYGTNEASGDAFVGTSYNGNAQETCVTRYKFTTDSSGATSISFKTAKCTLAVNGSSTSNDSVVNIRFIINTSATNYINPSTAKRQGGYGYPDNLSYKLQTTSGSSSYLKGTLDITLQPNTTYYLWVFPYYSFAGYTRWNLGSCTITTSGSVVQPSTISASNGVFGSPIPISLSNSSSLVTNTVTVTCAGITEPLQTESSVNSLSWTPAVSTYASQVPEVSTTATITTTTYYDNNPEPIGSNSKTITVVFSSDSEGILPTITASTFVPSNTGSASSFNIFIQGYSKVSATLNAHAGTGATIQTISLTAEGITTTVDISSEAVGSVANRNLISSNILDIPNDASTVTLSLVDSRNFSTTITSSIKVFGYTPPTVINEDVHRCTSTGAADDAGTYLSVVATASISDLGSSGGSSRNTASLTVNYVQAGGTYNPSDEVTLVSGVVHTPIGGGLISVDKTYTVRITVTDSLGNSVPKYITVTSQKWAMKFNSDASAVAFGKAPEASGSKYLEIPEDWTIRRKMVTSPFSEFHAIFSDEFDPDLHTIKTYSSIVSLGLTSGSASLASIWSALPANSLLIAEAAQFISSELPNVNGTVEMCKVLANGSRGWIEFHGIALSDGDYRMAINTSNAPSGVWTQIVNGSAFDDMFTTQSVACTEGVSKSANQTFNFDTSVPSVSGYTPICVVGWKSTGMTYLTLANMFYSNGAITISGRNIGSSAVTPLYNVTVLYVKNS